MLEPHPGEPRRGVSKDEVARCFKHRPALIDSRRKPVPGDDQVGDDPLDQPVETGAYY